MGHFVSQWNSSTRRTTDDPEIGEYVLFQRKWRRLNMRCRICNTQMIERKMWLIRIVQIYVSTSIHTYEEVFYNNFTLHIMDSEREMTRNTFIKIPFTTSIKSSECFLEKTELNFIITDNQQIVHDVTALNSLSVRSCHREILNGKQEH